ncbi:hypothetical protein PISL3812_05275 [Talaromyces islandicus]|uniref:HMA domain-containing protein n=1 Tax=Talaromyces islandicus TaxID=28573 RepID=A0A0U1LY11_TALIS|nr:hypothetical protein PISL3812_05275 [Talaromyces islandicus]
MASGLITVQHDPTLLDSTISKALEDVGLDIRQISQSRVGDSQQALGYSDEEVVDDEEDLLERVFKRWKRSQPAESLEKRTAMHYRYCDFCRLEGKKPWGENSSSPPVVSQGALSEPFVVIDNAESLVPVRVTVSIVGMTCGTCVGKISEALEAHPWSQSVDISLLSNSATITLSDKGRVKDIIESIKEIGYEATVEKVEELKDSQPISEKRSSDIYRASYSISGMTCSTCIGTISNALRQHTWIKQVDINLISNSAVIVYQGKHNQAQITDSIQNVGYDAVVNDVVQIGNTERQNQQKEVLLRVSGMFCENCPRRVHDSLAEFGRNVTIMKHLSIENPIMKIQYTPNAPEFTIRDILASISASSPSFEVSIYHPPTLEERSQAIHIREQWRLFLRVILSVTVAIPCFIIAIALGSLAPSGSRVRYFLTSPIWSGQVTRADWALFIMATPVYFLAADIFHRRALKEIWAMWRRGSRTPLLQRFYRFGSMNTLMSLGTSIAYISSIAQLILAATNSSQSMLHSSSSTYFDSVVFLTMFLLIGKLIESYSRSKTGDAVKMLGSLRPAEALLVVPHSGQGQLLQPGDYSTPTRRVSIDLLELGDIIRIPHGSSPPWDGSVVEGDSEFDESSLTGESQLVRKHLGDEVFSGSVNRGRPVSIQITGVAGDSMLDQIIQIVREGQARRAPVERLADTLTAYFVPSITLIAVSTFIIWLILGLSGTLPQNYLDIPRGGWPLWSLQFAIAVFVIACPCGIALAAPTALFVGGGIAAQNGILVKGGGQAFQEASQLDCVVFDKTGTLTQGGEPVVTDHAVSPRGDTAQISSMVHRLEEASSHPIAKAIAAFYKSEHLQDVQARSIDEIPGKGMKGTFTSEGRDVEVIVGSEALMTDYGVDLENHINRDIYSWRTQGKSTAIVASNTGTLWQLEMCFAIADPLRQESHATVDALKRRNIDVWMISGDNIATAMAVGDMVGIHKDNIIAEVLPGQKAEKIRHLQNTLRKPNTSRTSHRKLRQRATIAMVGDGINDSPALTVADVGIAIGSGSDIAISSAEFILVSSQLDSVLTLIDLSRTVMTRIKFNFGWALVYNLIALPIAAGVLYAVKNGGSHVRLDPVWASLAMALSSVSVVCSSLLLKSRLPLVGFQNPKKKT